MCVYLQLCLVWTVITFIYIYVTHVLPMLYEPPSVLISWPLSFSRWARGGEVSVCSISCRWKTEIIVITSSPSQLLSPPLPLKQGLFLWGLVCVQQLWRGKWALPVTLHNSPSLVRPGWRGDYRGFVFPAFPSSSPLMRLLLPLRQAAHWCRIEGVCLQGTGEALWHGVPRNTLIASWMAASSHLRQLGIWGLP